MIRPIRELTSTTESAYLLLDIDLPMKSGCGMFGWCTFMKLMFMKNGAPALCGAVEIVEDGLLDVSVEERDADDALIGRINVLAIDLKSSCG